MVFNIDPDHLNVNDSIQTYSNGHVLARDRKENNVHMRDQQALSSIGPTLT